MKISRVLNWVLMLVLVALTGVGCGKLADKQVRVEYGPTAKTVTIGSVYWVKMADEEAVIGFTDPKGSIDSAVGKIVKAKNPSDYEAVTKYMAGKK